MSRIRHRDHRLNPLDRIIQTNPPRLLGGQKLGFRGREGQVPDTCVRASDRVYDILGVRLGEVVEDDAFEAARCFVCGEGDGTADEGDDLGDMGVLQGEAEDLGAYYAC